MKYIKYKKISATFFLAFLQVFFIFNLKSMQSREMLPPAQVRLISKDNIIEKYIEKKNKAFKYFFTGQVAAAASYDSNQYVGLVQDAVLFYPAAQKLDATGLDINDKDQSDMFALNASIKSLFSGPDLWGAKVLGRIEFAFSGIKNDIAGITNLSSSYVSFLWKNTEVRFGHFFHPLALDNIYPTPVSGSEGLGYDPSRRSPMIRIVHRIDKFRFILSVAKVFDSIASNRAAMPDLFGQLNLKLSDKYIFGAGLNYHSEVPRLQTDNGYKTTEQVNGLGAFVFARLMLLNFLVKTRFTYIENGNNFGIMGSYSVVSRNAVTDERIYAPMRTASIWADIVFVQSKKIEPAVFIGFAKNIGTSKKILKCYTQQVAEKDVDISLININSLVQDAQYMFQISPRARMQVKDFIFGFEAGYYRAAFAKNSLQAGWQDDYDCNAKVVNAKPASDMRLIFSVIYTF